MCITVADVDDDDDDENENDCCVPYIFYVDFVCALLEHTQVLVLV